MTAQPLDWEEFYRLVSGWADNELTSSDWQRFSTLMTGSAEAREAYVRYAALHAMLELAHVPPTECGRPPDTSTRMEDVEHPAGLPWLEDVAQWPENGESSPRLSRPRPRVEGSEPACLPTRNRATPAWCSLGGRFGPGFRQLCSRSNLPFLALLVLCGLTSFWIGSVLAGRVSPNRALQPVTENPSRESSSPAPLHANPIPATRLAGALPASSPSASVARVTRVTNARWTTAEAVLQKSAGLAVGQKIDLAAGEAEIMFGSGACRGPARGSHARDRIGQQRPPAVGARHCPGRNPGGPRLQRSYPYGFHDRSGHGVRGSGRRGRA